MPVTTGVQVADVRVLLLWRFVVSRWVAPLPTPGQETVTTPRDGMCTESRGKLAESSCPSVATKLSNVALAGPSARSEEHTSELQSHSDLVCRLLLETKK